MLIGLHVLKFLKNNLGQGIFFISSYDWVSKGFYFLFWLGDMHVLTLGDPPHDFIKRTMDTIFVKDFLIPQTSPIIIHCDNKSTLYVTTNPVFCERTKHIEINCHVVIDKVQAVIFHLLPVSSKEQVSDIFTKSLQSGPFSA
jgi:hypothetical protein